MDEMMYIPKIIHYCWFGGNALPKQARKCIESWKKFLPDYEIRRWDESNFDVYQIDYTKEAYECKKYAFVSDYARFWILYKYGGLYFDTDILVIRDYSGIVKNGPFLGFEQPEVTGDNKTHLPNDCCVNPGLGMGCISNNEFLKELLEFYKTLHFKTETDGMDMTTIVQYTTDKLLQRGLVQNNELQYVADFWIYPYDFLCPYNFYTKKCSITDNTISIHLYSQSWHTKYEIIKMAFLRMVGHRMTEKLVVLKRKVLKLLNKNR